MRGMILRASFVNASSTASPVLADVSTKSAFNDLDFTKPCKVFKLEGISGRKSILLPTNTTGRSSKVSARSLTSVTQDSRDSYDFGLVTSYTANAPMGPLKYDFITLRTVAWPARSQMLHSML